MNAILALADVHLGRPQHDAKKTGPGIDWALGALERGAAAGAGHLVVVGDIIDRKRFTDETYGEVTRFFARGLELFDTVTFTAGNHDVHHDLTRIIPPRVATAGTEPQTIRAGTWALHTAAVEVDRDSRRLVPSFPPPLPGSPNIGLLHTSVTGEHSNHDCLPCTEAELRACGYDAWLLGHVHQRMSLADAPPISWIGMGHTTLVEAAAEDGLTVRLRELA